MSENEIWSMFNPVVQFSQHQLGVNRNVLGNIFTRTLQLIKLANPINQL